jgi:hypothetical protein
MFASLSSLSSSFNVYLNAPLVGLGAYLLAVYPIRQFWEFMQSSCTRLLQHHALSENSTASPAVPVHGSCNIMCCHSTVIRHLLYLYMTLETSCAVIVLYCCTCCTCSRLLQHHAVSQYSTDAPYILYLYTAPATYAISVLYCFSYVPYKHRIRILPIIHMYIHTV